MFSICPKKVYQNNQLSGTDLRVYLIIQGFADENGYCFPSVAKIADICGVSKSTIFRSLHTLEQFELVAREKRLRDSGGFTSNAYYLKLDPDNDVSKMTLGASQICDGGSVKNATPNKNQFKPECFLNTKGARVGARKTDDWSSNPISVSVSDINNVLSFVEKHKQVYNDYDFFLTSGNHLRARPKSSVRCDSCLEQEMIKFFSFRDFSICNFNDRYLNEVPVILEGVFNG